MRGQAAPGTLSCRLCPGNAMFQSSSLRSHLQSLTSEFQVMGGGGCPLDFSVNLVLFSRGSDLTTYSENEDMLFFNIT